MQTDYNNDGCLDILRAARRLGCAAAQVAAAQQLQRHVHRRDRGQRPGAAGDRARRPRSGPTSTTTACSTCSSATRTPPRSCSCNNGDGTFEDIAQAAGVDAHGVHQGRGRRRLRQRRLARPLRLELRRRATSSTTTTATARSPKSARGGRRPRPGQGLRHLVLRLRQRRLAGPVRRPATSRRSTRRCAPIWGCRTNADTLEAVSQPGRTARFQDVTRAGRARQGLHADGRQLRRHRQRRLPRHLPRHGQSVVRVDCVPSVLLRNQGGRSFVDVTASSGTGELHKGHGVAFADLDNDGDEDIVVRGGRRHARRRARAAAVREPRPRQRLDHAEAGGREEQPRRHRRPHHRARSPAARRAARDPPHRRRAADRSARRRSQQHIGLGTGAGPVDVEIWWPDQPTRGSTFAQRRRRTSRSRSRSSRGTRRSWSGRVCAWAAQEQR